MIEPSLQVEPPSGEYSAHGPLPTTVAHRPVVPHHTAPPTANEVTNAHVFPPSVVCSIDPQFPVVSMHLRAEMHDSASGPITGT